MIKYSRENYADLAEMGYTYNIREGGWISEDKATIVYEMRQPYIGQVRQNSADAEAHEVNLASLVTWGYVSD